MPDVTLKFTTDHLNRYKAYMCAEHGYDLNKKDGETKAAFTKRMLIEQMRRDCLTWEQSNHTNTENQYVKSLQDDWEAANPPPDEITIA